MKYVRPLIRSRRSLAEPAAALNKDPLVPGTDSYPAEFVLRHNGLARDGVDEAEAFGEGSRRLVASVAGLWRPHLCEHRWVSAGDRLQQDLDRMDLLRV
jgi:hypothetical protein